MPTDPIENMRARVAQCRRLADAINHPEASATLRQMAEEGEADIKRLEAERQARGSELDS